MAKTWKQIMEELGRIPPEQTIDDREEMLREKGMTWAQFTATEEWMEQARAGMEYRFSSPDVFSNPKSKKNKRKIRSHSPCVKKFIRGD